MCIRDRYQRRVHGDSITIQEIHQKRMLVGVRNDQTTRSQSSNDRDTRTLLDQEDADDEDPPVASSGINASIKYFCCPKLTTKSFTFAITLIDVIVYVICLILGGVKHGKDVLSVNPHILFILGEKYPYYMRYHYEFHRFICPVFLHVGLLHLIFNCFSQLSFGSRFESINGVQGTVILYFGSAFGGVLLSSLLSDSPAAGASTAICGLLGARLLDLLLNWNSRQYSGRARRRLLFWVVFLLIANLGLGHRHKNIDNVGHLGGAATGAVFSLLVGRKYHAATRLKTKATFAILIYLLGGLLTFYMARKPSPQQLSLIHI
eukprot:TRINITY_DN1875_c0_g1_i8.p1 TRINITY_DN1875_c0_g1~~TRINITY_DN1875_c0_g1_i8.p1  ORF type:complete len:347 (-),score=28.12 TRINITY_DN1875_c0_g1_i8:61-1017(-)